MTHKQEQEFVGNCAGCVHEFTWRNPKAGLAFLRLFLDLCTANRSDPKVASEFIANFVDHCEHHEFDLKKGLAILEDQDWEVDDGDHLYVSPQVQKRLDVLGLTADGVLRKEFGLPALGS